MKNLENQVSDLQDRLETVQAKRDRLDKESSESRSELTSAKSEVKSLHGKLEILNQSLDKTKSTEHKMNESLCKVWKTVRNVRADMKALRVQAVSQLKLIPQMINKNDEIWQGLRDRAKKLSERVRVAETSYNREWKERRRLFNIVQEFRGNIRVMCRVRPKLERESGEMICSVPMEGAITVQNLRKRREKTWEFDEVFSPSQTTSDLFEEVEPLVTSVMDGYNVCIFAYGQTGSGKTYVGVRWRQHANKNKKKMITQKNTHSNVTDTQWKEQRKIQESIGVL